MIDVKVQHDISRHNIYLSSNNLLVLSRDSKAGDMTKIYEHNVRSKSHYIYKSKADVVGKKRYEDGRCRQVMLLKCKAEVVGCKCSNSTYDLHKGN